MGVDMVIVVGMDVVIVVVMVMCRIPDTIIIILLTPSNEKTHFTARSGIMVRQNKKMEKVYIKNPSRLLKRLATDAKWKDTGLVPVVRPNIW